MDSVRKEIPSAQHRFWYITGASLSVWNVRISLFPLKSLSKSLNEVTISIDPIIFREFSMQIIKITFVVHL